MAELCLAGPEHNTQTNHSIPLGGSLFTPWNVGFLFLVVHLRAFAEAMVRHASSVLPGSSLFFPSIIYLHCFYLIPAAVLLPLEGVVVFVYDLDHFAVLLFHPGNRLERSWWRHRSRLPTS